MIEIAISFSVFMSSFIIGIVGAVPFYALYQGARASLMD